MVRGKRTVEDLARFLNPRVGERRVRSARGGHPLYWNVENNRSKQHKKSVYNYNQRVLVH